MFSDPNYIEDKFSTIDKEDLTEFLASKIIDVKP